MKNALLPRIMALASRAQAAQTAMQKPDCQIDWEKWNADDREMSAELEAIDKAAGQGLAIGRRLSFGVADGGADYLITKICKNHVQVEWIPLCDGYRSQAVGLSADRKHYIVLISTAMAYCNMAAFAD